MPELPEELRTRPPRRAGQEPTATLTLDAYNRLKAELEDLTGPRRAEITEKIKVAREHGDLRENAEYHAAKDEQGLMKARIRNVQQMLRDPDIVEAPTAADAVGPGMLVTVKPLDFDVLCLFSALLTCGCQCWFPMTHRVAIPQNAVGNRCR